MENFMENIQFIHQLCTGEIMDSLTWDDLANLYHDRTGNQARIRPMEEIFNWAANQPDIKENEDGSLSLEKS